MAGKSFSLYVSGVVRSFAVKQISRRIKLASITLCLALPLKIFAQAQMATPDSFAVSPSGAATYAIPIQVPPGTAGMQPGLALSYSSQGGNGLAGVGWSLSGFSAITRCSKTLVQDGIKTAITLTNNDAFCLDGQRLFAISGTYGASGTQYRTEIESFSRVISSGSQGTGPYSFIVETKSGQIMHYTPVVSSGQTTAHIWTLALLRDKLQNCMLISYSVGSSFQEIYPLTIDYSGRYNSAVGTCSSTYNRVNITYEARGDVTDGYFGPARTKQAVRISRIDTSSPAGMVKRYALGYSTGPAAGRSRLASVTEYAGDGVTALPVTTFSYFDGGGGISVTDNRTTIANAGNWGTIYGFVPGDFNGDGVNDLYLIGTAATYFCPGPGIATANNCQQTSSSNFTGFKPITGDFNADGFTDLYFFGAGSYFCPGKLSLPGSACVQTSTTSFTSIAVQSGDLNGDGYSDLVTIQDSSPASRKLLRGCPGQTTTTSLVLTSCASTTTNPVNQAAAESSYAPELLLTDVDGVGSQQIVLSYTSYHQGFPSNVITNVTPQSFLCRYSDPGTLACLTGNLSAYPSGQITPGDFNGDGYTDLILVPQNNSGANWLFCAGPNPQVKCVSMPKLSIAQTSVGGARLKTHTGDYNGDGITDLIIVDDVFSGASSTWFCKGPGLIAANNCISLAAGQPAWIGTNTKPYPGDYNGDGVTDLILASPTVTQFAAGGSGQPDKLVAISDGLGVQTTITYKPLTDASVYVKESSASYPTIDVQAPLCVVSRASSSNGVGGTLATDYTYYGLKANMQGRGILGFSLTIAQRPVDAVNNQQIQTFYSQQFPHIGLMTQQDTYVTNSGAWRLIKRRTNSLSSTLTLAINGSIWFPYTSRNNEYNYDYGTGALATSTQTDFQFDSAGNPTNVSVSTNDGFSGSTTNTYLNNFATWVIGRLTGSTATRTSPGGATQTRTSSFSPDGNTGLLTLEIIEPNNAALKVITDSTYDAYGNKISVTVSSGATAADPAYFAPRTSYTYFEVQGTNPAGRFPTRVVNALGQTEYREFNVNFGGMNKLTGPNGLVTQWDYDAFGRKLSEIRPDGTSTNFAYGLCSCPGYPDHSSLSYRISSQSTGEAAVYHYFDQLNRPVLKTRTGLAAELIDFDNVWYDAYGRIANSYRPYVRGAGKNGTSFVYDPLGRVVSSTASNGLLSTYGYNGLTASITVNNSAGVQTTSKTVNSQGWTTSTTDAAFKITSFSYDPNGNLLTTTDPKGNAVSMSYDLQGRKTAMADPDMGLWTYGYDALGQLKKQTDAKLQVSNMTYDLLGRMTQRAEPSLISNWFYDKYANNSACNKGVGKLCEVTSNNGFRRVFTYDGVGRNSKTSTYLDSPTIPYDIDNSYDASGRLDAVTYPAVTIGTITTRLAIKHNYSAQGYLFKVTNPTGTLAYWTGTAANASGQFTAETLGNNLITTRTYDNVTGRLSAINTDNGVQNMTYGYDTIGNLTARTNTFTLPTAATINEIFGYDVMNRLTSLTMSGTTSLTKSYSYNEIGNIITKSDVGTLNYPASGANSVRPHAVSSILGSAGGYNNPTYSYDANGNMTSSMTGSRTVTYTSFNMPASIVQAGTTTFVYDADHNRTKESSGNGDLYFVNPGNVPLFEKHANYNATGVTRYRHFIAGVGIYTQYSNGVIADTKYTHQDHLGSTTVITSSAKTVLERYSYDPFGRARAATGADAPATTNAAPWGRRGFTGHETLIERGGLIHMNGRIYDPHIGRFMSADPYIQFAGYSQSHNRYSYIMNNPLGGTDPSGYGFRGIFDGGGWLNPLSRQHRDFARATFNFAKNPFNNFNIYALERSMPGRATLDNFMLNHHWAMGLGHAALGFAAGFCYGGWAACYGAMEAHVAGYQTWLAGGDRSDVTGAMITAGAVGFIAAGSNGVIGGVFTSPISNILAHAVFGCAIASAQGGSCGAGALAGALTAGVDQIDTGNFWAGAALAMATGCVGSAAGGGTCADGIASSALVYLFNKCMSFGCPGSNRNSTNRNSWDTLVQTMEGTGYFIENYSDMRTANTIGADKYFHCKANCQAAQLGATGVDVAKFISDTREYADVKIFGSSIVDSYADQLANVYGRTNGALSPNTPCSIICGPYRPNGLDPRF